MSEQQQQPAQLQVYDDNSALCHACATLICQQSAAAIAERSVFHLVLAGGSTPRALYQLLASDAYRERIDWQHCHIWFGDERAVPHDHPDSNFLMAQQALLQHIDMPGEQIHAMAPLPEQIQAAAEDYEKIMAQTLPKQNLFPVFDLVLLGLGPDGHTASLFPGTTALTEEKAWVAAVYVDKLASWRLTLTYPVLENARRLVFLVSGTDKAAIIGQLFQSAADLPAARLQHRANTLWLLDQAAMQAVSQ